MTILVTGGAGFIGSNFVHHWLATTNESVVNLDKLTYAGNLDNLASLQNDARHVFVQGDIGDTTLLPQLLAQHQPRAVVHFAAVPRVLLQPDNETFRVNVMGTYNVIESAMKLGIRKVIIASSETTYGVCFAEGDTDYHAFPLEEDYDVDPMDSYGLSKVTNEKTARAFAARYKADIYALRIGNVIEPHDYARFPGFVANPPLRKRNAWSYIDARDLGQIVHRCLQTDGLGFQVFNAVNDTITADGPTGDFLKKWCPNTPHLRTLVGDEAPLSNRKIREKLGFKEGHPWRAEVARLAVK
jgi:UDP-glucose 4-epimerase